MARARRVLEGLVMHALFFGMKRAFHGTLRIVREPLKDFQLTAARFDMLWAIYRKFMRRSRQSEVRRELGVSAPTVSRMVKSLAAMGFVRTVRDEDDRRHRLVVLTKRGIERMRAAIRRFIQGNFAQLALEKAFGRGEGHDENTRQVVFRRMRDFEDLLRCVREAFGDRGKLHYPWPSDDGRGSHDATLTPAWPVSKA